MTTDLLGTIEAVQGGADVSGVVVVLHIVNTSDATVEILNPDIGDPSPEMNWPWSPEAYRASLLMSFGYLRLTLADQEGETLAQEAVQTWSTPVLRPRVALAPGATLDVALPLAPFFRLSGGETYDITAEYGDKGALISAKGRVEVTADSSSA